MERSQALEMLNCIHGEPTGNNYASSLARSSRTVSNAALGLGDMNDRTFPELVPINSKEDPAAMTKTDISSKFSSVYVEQIQMSRLHTVIVTNDHEGNVRSCGFGSGGR